MVSMNRQLPKEHPIHALFAPHVEGTALINWGAHAVRDTWYIHFAPLESARLSTLPPPALVYFDGNDPHTVPERALSSWCEFETQSASKITMGLAFWLT